MKSTQTADVEFIRDLPKELVNNIGTYTSRGLKQADTRLYERKTLDFRQIVDSVFPTMLIIDYNNIERELKKYSDIGQSLKAALGDAYTPSLDKKYDNSKLSDKEIELIVKTIKLAAKQFATKAISVSQRNLLSQLNQIVRFY